MFPTTGSRFTFFLSFSSIMSLLLQVMTYRHWKEQLHFAVHVICQPSLCLFFHTQTIWLVIQSGKTTNFDFQDVSWTGHSGCDSQRNTSTRFWHIKHKRCKSMKDTCHIWTQLNYLAFHEFSSLVFRGSWVQFLLGIFSLSHARVMLISSLFTITKLLQMTV